jgi:transcriptional regulator with XRE-family HTH domain
LASKLQITSQAVSKWEKGENYPDIQQLGSMCDLFKVSLDYLLYDARTELSKKTDFRVFEAMENSNCKIDITNIYAYSDYTISLSILNKTNTEIELKHTYFLLLDIKGNLNQPKTRNILNSDDDLVGLSLLHSLPNFVPPNSCVQVELVFTKILDDVRLWIKIPNIIDGVYFSIHTKAHTTSHNQYGNLRLNKDELVDFYNFHFKNDDVDNIRQEIPKITNDIVDELIFAKTATFFKEHERLFSEEVLEKVVINEYINWGFASRYIKDPLVLREIVKKNFKEIESDITAGHGGILKYDSVQDFMDQEIIEFIIKMRAKYCQDYRKWTIDYINDSNIEKIRPEILSIKYYKNGELFDTKVSKATVNEIIRNSNISEINEHQVIKMKTFYNEFIEEKTMDTLLSQLPVNDLETLTRFKPLMSKDAWQVKKAEYFAYEQGKLDKQKNQI